VKLRQAVAAGLWGNVPTVMNRGEQTAKPSAGCQQMQNFRYDQSGAKTAANSASVAKHRLECESQASQDRSDRVPRTRRLEQGQHSQQQDAARQQPLPKLGPQRDHRQRVKCHRDVTRAGNNSALRRYPSNADDQRNRRADARDA
jgi:hypothetical protein